MKFECYSTYYCSTPCIALLGRVHIHVHGDGRTDGSWNGDLNKLFCWARVHCMHACQSEFRTDGICMYVRSRSNAAAYSFIHSTCLLDGWIFMHESDGGLHCMHLPAAAIYSASISKDNAARHGMHASMRLDGSDRGLACQCQQQPQEPARQVVFPCSLLAVQCRGRNASCC